MPVRQAGKMIIRNGRIRTIHDDDLTLALKKHGEVNITRASHVEPVGDKFVVDLRPVGGPKIGTFETHAAALECERNWLLNNNF